MASVDPRDGEERGQATRCDYFEVERRTAEIESALDRALHRRFLSAQVKPSKACPAACEAWLNRELVGHPGVLDDSMTMTTVSVAQRAASPMDRAGPCAGGDRRISAGMGRRPKRPCERAGVAFEASLRLSSEVS